MRPCPTRNATTEYTPPVGWNPERDGTCGNLSVRTEVIGIRAHHMSTWKPTLDELVILASGGVVELTCVGMQPPVAIRAIKE